MEFWGERCPYSLVVAASTCSLGSGLFLHVLWGFGKAVAFNFGVAHSGLSVSLGAEVLHGARLPVTWPVSVWMYSLGLVGP